MRFRVVRSFGLWLLSSTLLLIACDDGPGAGSGATALDVSQVSTFDDYVQRLTESYCDRLVVPCCAGTNPITREQCVSELALELREELLEDGGGNYLPQVGAACVAAVNKLTCGQHNDDSIETCEQVFERVARPGKAPGEACTTSQECAAPANGKATCGEGFCSSNGGCTSGTCFVEIEVAAGEPCSQTVTPASPPGNPTTPTPAPAPAEEGVYRACGRGHICDLQLAVCKPLPKAGEPCDFVCAGSALCQDKICRALAPDGAACAIESDCASFWCTGGVCAARPVELCPFGSSRPTPPSAPAPTPSPG